MFLVNEAVLRIYVVNRQDKEHLVISVVKNTDGGGRVLSRRTPQYFTSFCLTPPF